MADSHPVTDSPSAESQPAAEAQLPPFNLKAVLTGVAVDLGGTLVVILLIGVVAAIAMHTRGASAKELEQQLTESSAIQVFYSVAGMFMSIVGGYVAARVSTFAHLKHGLLTGLVSAALGLASLTIPGSTAGNLWLSALVSLSAVPCATLGGYMASPKMFTEDQDGANSDSLL